MYVCMYMCVCVWACVCVCERVCVCVCARVCVHVGVRECVWMKTNVCSYPITACVHVCVDVCERVCCFRGFLLKVPRNAPILQVWMTYMPDPLELRQGELRPGFVMNRHQRLPDQKHVDVGVTSALVVHGTRVGKRRNIAHHQGVVA